MKKNSTTLTVVIPPIRVVTADAIRTQLAAAGLDNLPSEVVAPLEERLREEIVEAVSGVAASAVDRAVKRHLSTDAIGKLYMEEIKRKAAGAVGQSGSGGKVVVPGAGARG